MLQLRPLHHQQQVLQQRQQQWKQLQLPLSLSLPHTDPMENLVLPPAMSMGRVRRQWTVTEDGNRPQSALAPHALGSPLVSRVRGGGVEGGRAVRPGSAIATFQSANVVCNQPQLHQQVHQHHHQQQGQERDAEAAFGHEPASCFNLAIGREVELLPNSYLGHGEL